MQIHLSTQMKADRKHAAEAFTVVELLIVVACLSILAGIILPSLARQNRNGGCRINCANNLSYFAALDAEDIFPQRLLSGDRNLAISGRPAPHGLLQVWTNTAVTWFGPRHNGNGNIALADGSVQQVTSPRLRIVFAQSGMATNRLAIP